MSSSTVLAMALVSTRGIGSTGACLLAQEYESIADLAEAVNSGGLTGRYSRWADALRRLADGADAAQREAEREIARHIDQGIGVVAVSDEAYPRRLRLLADAPPLLYWLGDLAAASRDSVAIVGTRHPSPVAVEVTRRLSERFVRAGFCIVSGLAQGIDTAAHQAALDAGGSTVAVVGTPLDRVFPASNAALQQRIIDAGGCVLSELPLGHAGHPSDFAKRDRIQSGLSLGVVPIQTSRTGGTMHTVRYAVKQERLLVCPRPVASDGRADYGGVLEAIETMDCVVLEDAADYEGTFRRLSMTAAALDADGSTTAASLDEHGSGDTLF